MSWFDILPTPLLKLALLCAGVLAWQAQRKARAAWRALRASYTALGWQEPARYNPLTRGDQHLADALALEIGKEGKRNATQRRKAARG